MKKIIVLLLAVSMTLGLVGCSGDKGEETATETQSDEYDFSQVKIGIVGFFNSGENLDAITTYMDHLSSEVGFSYEYAAGSSYDEQTNITTVQNLISSGCDGIIMCMDSGMAAILEECESAGVYVAGFLTDMDSSLDTIKDNPYYLGNVCDGLYDNTSIGETAAEMVIEDGGKHVGVVSFPSRYYPQKQAAIDAFTEKIEEYNAGAEEDIEIYETTELSFSALEDTYFSDYPEVDSILGLASGFVYPTMANLGKTDVKLYTTCYKQDDVDAFLSGNIRMMTLSNTEALIYPLAMILNEVSGTPYADKPEVAERVDTSTVFVTNEEEMNALTEKCFLTTNDLDMAFVDAEDFKSYLTAYNSDATYDSLTAMLLEMSMRDIMDK